MSALRGIIAVLWLAVGWSVCGSGPAYAAEVAGVQIADRVEVGGQTLALNGAGVRTRFFFKVYVGALYAATKATTAAAIFDSPAPRRMLLHMLRGMDADTLYAALDEGLRNNLNAAELAAHRLPIEQLGAIMKSIGTVRAGDGIAIDFLPGSIEIGVNGKVRGRVEGAAFGQALLKVWLGDRPADAALKKALLGD